MNWETLYLICFLVGLMLTVASLVFGSLHIHLHVPHAFHFAVHRGADSAFNLSSILMFLTWFGGTGYVMTRYRSATAGFALTAAVLLGFAGGALMYLYMTRVFLANERPLLEADYDMTGVLGHISSPVREKGTGELIYMQQGTRRSCGARSEDGRAIERGTEVVVMRYEKGIAYVKRFEELHGA
jgi:membrane protein implicated in regulation of membrane protease activity